MCILERSSKLGLLTRKQNDGKALTELDLQLRQFEPSDPVKYDFALFGLGVLKVLKTNSDTKIRSAVVVN
jgi:hypothetical protein